MSQDFKIEHIEDPSEDLREAAVFNPLRTFNQAARPVMWELREQPEHEPKPVNLFAFGSEGRVLAGLFGETQFAWLKIDLMATAEEVRGQGIGRQLDQPG